MVIGETGGISLSRVLSMPAALKVSADVGPAVRFGADNQEVVEVNGATVDFWPARPNRFIKWVSRLTADGVGRFMGFRLQVSEADRARLDRLQKDKSASRIYILNHPTGFFDLLSLTQLGLDAYRIGAREIFETRFPVLKDIPVLKNIKARFLQGNGVFSVERALGAEATLQTGAKVLADGGNIAMFYEGFVSQTVDQVSADNIKPGAARMALRAAGQGRDTDLVPVTMVFDVAGDREQISERLSKAVSRMERKLRRRAGHASKPLASDLSARLERLFGVMVSEREHKYQVMYGLRLDRAGLNPYQRLHALREKTLARLEADYFGEVKTGSHERRARKLSGYIRGMQVARDTILQKAEPGVEGKRKNVWLERRGNLLQYWRDRQTLNDMLGLSTYPENYLADMPDSLARQIETYAKLSREIYGPPGPFTKVVSFFQRLRFLQMAKISCQVYVGEPIAVPAGKTYTSESGEALSLVNRVQAEMQTRIDRHHQSSRA